MRILLVEDDESVAKALEKTLTDEHYTVDVAYDGLIGWQLVNTYDYDLVVLDVMLPQLDGLQLCQRLRKRSYTMPVLLLTALDTSTKKIAGFNAGADDYITKPFELEELLARVRVLLRRVQTPVLSTLQSGKLQLDLNSREVTYGEICLNLTPKEYGLLELFLRNPSQVFSRGGILDNLWSCSEAPGEDTVTSHIKGLRRKLSQAGAPSDLIKTVYGVGYRLNSVETPAPDVEIESVTQKQKTQTALVTLWHLVKSQHLERLEILKNTAQALQQHTLTDELRQAAARAAHSLTGALGIFGLKSGSELARAIEQILQGQVPIADDGQQQLSSLVNALAEQLNQALSQLEQSKPRRRLSPLLVLIDNNVSLLQQLAKALQAQGLTVEVALHESDLYRLRQGAGQPFLENTSGAHPSNTAKDPGGTLPDVMLLNFSLADSDVATLERLSEVINQVPPLLVLVGSADGSLASRVKAARLGSHSFFHSPDSATLLERILAVRSHLPQPANTVLAVDDDPQVLEALRALLEPRGLRLITLNQPLNFWATLQASTPDLLLLDMEMPNFNGIELCRAVRQAPVWNQLPIVFFTAHSDASAKTAALRAGANDLVEKSLADSDLFGRLCDQLRRSQLQQTMATLAH
ncbi:MAG: response regulator [Cyanobacteria bacterium P01_H01_bin.26]